MKGDPHKYDKAIMKKRFSQEISDLVADQSNDNTDELQTNKRIKEGIENNKESSNERETNNDMNDKPIAWLSALTERIRTDNRIGFPKKQPPIAELNHGWLMDANKEVLHALIKPEFSKYIISFYLSDCIIISLKCIMIIHMLNTLSRMLN